jgi:hypothetical protein
VQIEGGKARVSVDGMRMKARSFDCDYAGLWAARRIEPRRESCITIPNIIFFYPDSQIPSCV